MAHARLHLAAVVGYCLIAVVFTWPLATNLFTHLTGPVAGDTGVYVWNQWVFRHELVEERSNPYFTGRIFSLTRPADLSLHNYTTFANVLALPLMKPLGVVATFNVVYLAMVVLTAYGMFLLARSVTGGAALESWLAGVLFAWSPTLVGRSMGHFSLASAAPLPIFLLLLIRAHRRGTIRDAIAVGIAAAVAAFTDVYYAVFCLMIAAGYVVVQIVDVRRASSVTTQRRVRIAVDLLIACIVSLTAAIAVTGGWQFTLGGRPVSVRSLYTPVMVATVLVVVRVAWRYRARVAAIASSDMRRTARLAAASGVAATILLSPVLYGVGQRMREGRFDDTPVFWRSSPPGVDVAALVLPNPHHPWSPASWRQWLATAGDDSYMENVASLSLVTFAVLVIAFRAGWRPPRLWLVLAAIFGWLALGPFVHVAQLNTFIPTPWSVLRYVPLIGLVRSPARFMVVLLLALAVLFALALAFLTAHHQPRRRMLLGLVTVLLLFELFPAPRVLHSAELPRPLALIAADPRRDVRVMHLPLGVRDGRAMVGRLTARSQFYQTFHEKPVIGGLLSRVSRRRVAEMRQDRVVDALLDLSANAPLSEQLRVRLFADGPSFIRRANVGYVVLDRVLTPEELMKIAPVAFDLTLADADDRFYVYVPRTGRVEYAPGDRDAERVAMER
jgi:hypothetical protein